jgi:hypothetical protein
VIVPIASAPPSTGVGPALAELRPKAGTQLDPWVAEALEPVLVKAPPTRAAVELAV